MKIKAIGDSLSRIPGGLSKQLVKDLNDGKSVEVEAIPAKLSSLVEEVKSTSQSKKKESE